MIKRNDDPEKEFSEERRIVDIKNDAISVLNAFKKRNQKKLRKLNDLLMKILVPHFSKQLFELTVLSYILSKIVSKPRFLTSEYEERMRSIEEKFEVLIRELDFKSEEEISQRFEEINEAIRNLEKEDPRFVQDLISKGKLKVAATVYAQGISLGVASSITGMDKQDILGYAGKTMMFDRVKEEKSIHERLKVARQLIKK
jgi:predicted RNA-binding protein Jag